METTDEKRAYFIVTAITEVVKLKKCIAKTFNIPVRNQCLTFNGKSLREDQTLGEYNLQDHDTLNVRFEAIGGMYHFTSGRQDFHCLSYATADAIKKVLSFNIECIKHPRHLSSAKLQDLVLQGRTLLSALHHEIQGVLIDKNLPDLKEIILPAVTDDTDSSDSEDDMLSDQ